MVSQSPVGGMIPRLSMVITNSLHITAPADPAIARKKALLYARAVRDIILEVPTLRQSLIETWQQAYEQPEHIGISYMDRAALSVLISQVFNVTVEAFRDMVEEKVDALLATYTSETLPLPTHTGSSMLQ